MLLLVVVVLLLLLLLSSSLSLVITKNGNSKRNSMLYMTDTVADVQALGVREVLKIVCGENELISPKDMFDKVSVVKAKPTVCKYIVANPKAFLDPANDQIVKNYGFDISAIDKDTPLIDLARKLPVIYLADIHQEYGTLGLQLNAASDKTLNDFHPALKMLRDRPVYNGGLQNRGSAFTMVHKKIGFPDNRAWKGIPGNTEFKLFFSPDVAMANELCSTKDAIPNDFKFFQFTTVWSPKQLDLEYEKKLWLTVEGPVHIIFEDDKVSCPLWRRVVASLHL